MRGKREEVRGRERKEGARYVYIEKERKTERDSGSEKERGVEGR